eukprot:983038_1
MEYQRHWQFTCRLYKPKRRLDILWNQKLNRTVWRGATTGSLAYVNTLKRLSFVRQYQRSMLVSVLKLVQLSEYSDEVVEELNSLMKDRVNEVKLLQYKYLVSIEGNDVASNLNWLLMSNSVVFMAPPTKETWLMEGLLKPYVHYIPLTYRADHILKWNLEE